MDIPTGPRAYPLVGHLLDFLPDKLGFLLRCAAEYGDVVRLRLGSPAYLLNDPEDIRHVLETNQRNYEKGRRLTGAVGKQRFGDSLLTSVGTDHLRRRRLLQPLFTAPAGATFADLIVALAEQRVASWKDGAEIDVADEMMCLAQEIAGSILFGCDYAREDSAGFGEAIRTRRRYIQYLFDFPLSLAEQLPARIVREHRREIKRIDGALGRMADARRLDREPHADLLSRLMHAHGRDGGALTDQQVRDEVLALAITGYETIGEALAWTWYLLSQHEQVFAKLLAEVDAVLAGRTPTADDLPSLQCVQMVLDEAMRLYPPTWLFVRVALQADTLPGGATIPAGAKVYLCPYVTQRNPRYFPQPERFDPQRFTAPARDSRPKYAYFPFGGGVRRCIGQPLAQLECILVLATIARRVALALLPGQTIVPVPGVTLRPKKGIRMRVHTRS
ncbi:MAG TPA: cytochrome P450 [Ardenticatenaceae bacterium]|nr:cytochrome P450 [Ardenticatenaceae bacterium]